MNDTIRVLAIAGSLRGASYNRGLIRAAIDLAPDGVEISAYQGLSRLPFYDGDVEDAGVPEAVVRFKAAIAAADALLIATPEYNDGTSGVLKNAIDWASRGPTYALAGKPVAVMGASLGRGAAKGGIESVQRSMRRARSLVVDQTVAVPFANASFDETGSLVDPGVATEVAALVGSLAGQVDAGRRQLALSAA